MQRIPRKGKHSRRANRYLSDPKAILVVVRFMGLDRWRKALAVMDNLTLCRLFWVHLATEEQKRSLSYLFRLRKLQRWQRTHALLVVPPKLPQWKETLPHNWEAIHRAAVHLVEHPDDEVVRKFFYQSYREVANSRKKKPSGLSICTLDVTEEDRENELLSWGIDEE